MSLENEVRALAERARKASVGLAQTTGEERDAALDAMAGALRAHASAIVEANAADMAAAREAGTSAALLDRLMLDEGRVEAMAAALEDLRALPDPLGRALEERTLYNGLELSRVSVPLGVVAVVYEARPNVTADAAGICLKSGNACILRGGSLAARSNAAIAEVLHAAAVAAGMPEGCVTAITTTDRAATDALMQLHGLVDVLIPRGGAGLIRHCVECSKVPVIETGTGNCHVYVHASADLGKARDILLNAKCRRYGVCNAAETLLVDEEAADAFLPETLAALGERGVTVHADERAQRAAADLGLEVLPATEEDWESLVSDPARRGHLVESAVGAYLIARSQSERFSVHWWRERDAEVDFVVAKGHRRTAIEVKGGRAHGAALGLGKFLERFPGSSGLVVGSESCPLESFLLGEVPLFS